MLVVFYVVCVLYLNHILYFSILWLFGGRGDKLYGREPEVEFVTDVTHGGRVKFLPVA